MIVSYLDEHCLEIEAEIRQALSTFEAKADYSVVWKEYEKQAIKEFISVIEKLRIATGIEFVEGEAGSDKNRLADLLVCNGIEKVLISIKASRSNKDSANDLGTIRQYAEKKALYTACYDIWIKYDDSVKPIQVKGVYFDRSFKFVGKMSRDYGSGVSYRKKDGNMRPKKWGMFDSRTCYWNTIEEFEAGIAMSRSFRANSIVLEHIEDMTLNDKHNLFSALKETFEPS
jgi:hypothetical protein